MGSRLLKYSKEEIDYLLQKGLIRHCHSPWSCPTFYVISFEETHVGHTLFLVFFSFFILHFDYASSGIDKGLILLFYLISSYHRNLLLFIVGVYNPSNFDIC